MKNFNVRLYAASAEPLLDKELMKAALALLDEERREKALMMKNENGRRLSVCAGLLLKMAVEDTARDTGISFPEPFRFIYRENSKPFFEGRDDLFFNLSHSEELAICAVAPCEVGCDVEKIAPGRDQIAGRYYTEEEREFAAQGEECFFRIWTLKESFLKVTGKGLALPLRDFSINMSGSSITVSQSVDLRHYSFAEYRSTEHRCFEGYCCSVCAADMGDTAFEKEVRVMELKELLKF